ncbi:TYW1 [Cordylochernes scorpioides]|uniref:TYW1 n=1 Tax=Cordylochernes scorpioides TaxID=51811 RepID=A0ABY6LWI0_9ARAC|nr:TYW1 [Cordylochernes scorpioides]
MVPTVEDGEPPSKASWFFNWIDDASNDFRLHKSLLSGLNYAIFAIGDSSYKENYNKKNLIEEEEENSEEEQEIPDELIDLEDLGKVIKAKNDTAKSSREMLNPTLRANLTKQGYKLIGTHSAVKMCRWTKSMLRGRGGCYKHTFYGIESHRCMETTPSLACANKCIFCWRHQTNPVGTEWKWETDSPKDILDGALQNHRRMINEFKGVPGVLPDRITEGINVKHCALSLVGEPIMYPHINDLLDKLHAENISTFLVTNAQFHDQIASLKPVTQLYVSVDAASKESLKKIDRPLFKDYWERFISSLKELSRKGQRTVYRLTLVNEFNTEEIQGYANLVKIGNPDFIEIKGVTYCGTGKSKLTMANVPWHSDVVKFSLELSNKLIDYEVACEHEHSNCVLLAHKKFKINGAWHTWIDYEKFHQLVSGDKPFTTMDYLSSTPAWAVFGDENKGFDPEEKRFYHGNHT